MTAIVANSQITTSVTVFKVAPDKQQQLIDIIKRAAEVIRKQPGFISINIHRSVDGTQVLSYSQWESREAFDDVQQNASVIPLVGEVLKLAKFEPHFYEVVAVIEAYKADKSKA